MARVSSISCTTPGRSLTVETRGPIDCLAREEWAALFSDHPDSYDNIVLTQRCGMDGFSFRTVVVRDESGPVLVLPTFQTRFDAASMADGKARGVVRALAGVFPGVLKPRLLGIGLVECEWGAIGVRAGTDARTLDRAWDLGMEAVHALSRLIEANAIVLFDLAPAVMERIPARMIRAFAPVQTSPCAQVPLPFGSLDEYLASLSRSTRQGLRRKLRANAQVRVERVYGLGAHEERILALYRSTVDRAPVVLGVQRPDYFRQVCEEVPGAHFVLYWLGERLLAFNLLVAKEGMLIDKYFCMDPELGRQHSLYFISWIENIRHATGERFDVYHAGPGAEDTKCHLGCRFVRTVTLFRHTNVAAHAVLAVLARKFARDTSVPPAVIRERAGMSGQAGLRAAPTRVAS